MTQDIPSEYICPKTGKLYLDPVINDKGEIIERSVSTGTVQDAEFIKEDIETLLETKPYLRKEQYKVQFPLTNSSSKSQFMKYSPEDLIKYNEFDEKLLPTTFIGTVIQKNPNIKYVKHFFDNLTNREPLYLNVALHRLTSALCRVLILDNDYTLSCDEISNEGFISLFYALKADHDYDILEHIVKHSLKDINRQSKKKSSWKGKNALSAGTYPILVAAQFTSNPKAIKLLVNSGADVKLKSKEGLTFERALEKNPKLTADQKVEIKKFVFGIENCLNDATPDEIVAVIKDPESNVKFSWALVARLLRNNHNLSCIQHILDNLSDHNVLKEKHNNPLTIACQYANDPQIIKLFLDHGADPNIKFPHKQNVWTMLESNNRLTNDQKQTAIVYMGAKMLDIC